MVRKRNILAFNALVMAISLNASASTFSSITVFGDSLSDTGNNGRWTWNSDQSLLYNEKLAASYGLSLTPSSKDGTNYAAGGATATPALNPVDNTQSQIQRWLNLTAGKADSNGLYIHWIGGNDLAAAVPRVGRSRAIVIDSATAAAEQIDTLLNAGAGLVVVPNLPDVSAAPVLLEIVLLGGVPWVYKPALQAAYTSLNAAATLDPASRQQAIHQALMAAASVASNTAAKQQATGARLIAAYDKLLQTVVSLNNDYNATEEKLLTQRGGNIAWVDSNKLFREILANPLPFGLTNTAGMACPPGVSATICTTSTAGFSTAQKYLFADPLHPGPEIHAILADYIQSVLLAPVQVTRLTQGTLAMTRGSQAMLDNRYQQLRRGDNPQDTTGVFGGYSGQYQRYSNPGSGRGNDNNLTIGVDYQLTDNILFGALISGAFDHQRPDNDFRYDAKGVQIAAFSHLQSGQIWLEGDVRYLTADYQDIRRSLLLGPVRRVEQGDTNAKLWGARLTAGYNFALTRGLTTGPVLQYAWDYSQVDGYSEKGNSSSAMRFGEQNSHSRVGSIGWRAETQFARLNPWVQVNYRHQFGDDTRRATGGLKSTALSFTRAAEAEDSDWVDFSLGADLQLSDSVSAFSSVSQTGGLSGGEQTSYTVGISATF